eukprot:g22461.t1
MRSIFLRGRSATAGIIGLSASASSLYVGELPVRKDKIWIESHHSVAFGPPHPIVPGHVLVVPRRPHCTSLAALPSSELFDLMKTAQAAQAKAESEQEADASNIALNMIEKVAHRRVPSQLHMHIIPRKVGDFEQNDEIFQRIDRWTYFDPQIHDEQEAASYDADMNVKFPDDASRKPRTAEEMHSEAYAYRQYLKPTGFARPNDNFPSDFKFARIPISAGQIFYMSPGSLSLAMVNLKPLVPGHVLVVSKRNCVRLSDLTDTELLDLWESVRTVVEMLQSIYNTNDIQIGVQDGLNSGQSVSHVHVHILPIPKSKL